MDPKLAQNGYELVKISTLMNHILAWVIRPRRNEFWTNPYFSALGVLGKLSVGIVPNAFRKKLLVLLFASNFIGSHPGQHHFFLPISFIVY